MKQYWIAFVVFAAITGGTFLGVSCSPKALSQGTIEINEVYANEGCTVFAQIDGGTGNNEVSFGYNGTPAQLYTFPNTVSPGNHTLDFTTNYTCGTGNSCEISGPLSVSSSYPLTFYVGAGEIFEAGVTAGGNCGVIQVGAVN